MYCKKLVIEAEVSENGGIKKTLRAKSQWAMRLLWQSR